MTESLVSGSPGGGAPASAPRSSNGLPWWFGIPFLLGGLVVVALGVVLLLDEVRYGSEGVAVQGTVVETLYFAGGADDGPSWAIRYEFVDPLTGRTHSGQSDVDEATYDAAFTGDLIEVTYLPAEPGKSRIGSPDPQLLIPLVVLGAGALFSIVGLGLLLLTRWLRRNVAPSWVRVSGDSISLNIPGLSDASFAGLMAAGAAAEHHGHDHAGQPVTAAFTASETASPPAAPQGPTSEADLRALDAKFAAAPASTDVAPVADAASPVDRPTAQPTEDLP